MSSARDQILGQVRRSLGRDGPLEGGARKAAEARLSDHPRGLVPERSKSGKQELVRLFVEKAEAAACTVAEVGSLDAVPDAIGDYLAKENLPSALKRGSHPDLEAVPWDNRPTLEVEKGRSHGDDAVSLSAAFSGIAETGTLALTSGPENPTTLNFLPENHIVLLRKSAIVGPYEDMWVKLRAARQKDGLLPRVVNMITGPSRTGDIEQTIELGAHGPLRLHILLLDDA